MIEIHSHVLPGIDDGAANPADCLLMLHEYVEQGVTDVIATPHMDFSQFSSASQIDSYLAQVNRLFDETRLVAKDKLIPISLHLGLELVLTSDLLVYLKNRKSDEGQSVSLAGSNYLLVELPRFLENGLQTLEPLLFQIQLMGYQAILAHPERSMRHPDTFPILEKWVRDDRVKLQINANAIVPPSADSHDSRHDRFHRRNQYVKQLIDDGMVHFVASDAHDPELRRPLNGEAYEEIRERYSVELAKMLCRDNPRRIIVDETVG